MPFFVSDPLDLCGDQLFPVLQHDHASRVFVPWTLVAWHAEQVRRNHGQSIAQIAARGGLALSELAAVLVDRPWRKISDEEAWRIVWKAYAHALAVHGGSLDA